MGSVESLDASAIMSKAGSIASDPKAIFSNMEGLAETLKNKAIEKVKQECRRRNIQAEVVDLLISVV